METAKLKKMMKTIDDALTAVSFAEEGETDAARSVMTDGRRVLLGLKAGRIDSKTLKYALNTAKRISARLDILYVSATNSSVAEIDPQLRNFEAELLSEGVRYRLITRTGCLKKQIIDYTNSEKEILFAVIESPASLDTDCNRGDTALSDLWQKLKCPLVVVMDGTGA
jgi:hypothetical protein